MVMSGNVMSRDGIDAPAVTPAASLLVIAPGPMPRVLMGRRPDDARFMPGVYVFPGGAVEPGDDGVTVASDFDPREVPPMAAVDPSEARSLGIAAIRETFEETGLLCAVSTAAASWDDVAAGRAPPDLSRLRYLGRALTPPVSRIRYHARFFFLLADRPDPPLVPSTELEDLRWVSVSDTGALPVPRVTRFMLEQLRARLGASELPAATPFYHHAEGEFRVSYDRLDAGAARPAEDSRR
ncbi:MAG: NUDIX hydrolase [Gammaproteobacteria bacterium]|nr:NUDIX hydrolase [Gammaproteobacteria bacterium]